jgi:hypothetical protein
MHPLSGTGAETISGRRSRRQLRALLIIPFVAAVVAAMVWLRHRTPVPVEAIDGPAPLPIGEPNRLERVRANLAHLVALIEGKPSDEGRAHRIEAAIATLKGDGQHLRDSVLAAVRCSSSACAVDFQSASPDAQRAIADDLAATSFDEQFRAVYHDEGRLTTRVYLAAFDKRSNVETPAAWSERTYRALARIHPQLSQERTGVHERSHP